MTPGSASAARSLKMSKQRLALRDRLWPDAFGQVWTRHGTKGFVTLPRVLPLVVHLISKLAKKGEGNPGRVYLDLWFRVFDEMFLEVSDEAEWAYSAGYEGTRAVRTWREHIQALVDLGFVRIQPSGIRELGYILLIDPYRAVEQVDAKGKLPKEWKNAFYTRAQKIGALPPAPG